MIQAESEIMAPAAKKVKSDPTEKKSVPPAEKKALPTENKSFPLTKFGEADLSDVILVVEEQEFHVHKMVLAARSRYFKTMFYGNFKEKNENRIELKEVSRVAFKRLMDFIYDGQISDEESFFSSMNVSTGFGELKTKHNDVPDMAKHIRDFWKVSSEVLELANRFDIRKSFQKYFQNMLDRAICTTANCFVCVTIHIFGFINGLYLRIERHKKHDSKLIKEWLKFAETAKIDQDDTLSKLQRFFKAIG